ncbi:MAG: hypothetical protein RBQ97_04190 [Acholeplasma sp.]|nr:hypothetical protein [Acholeplasma sp.]
MQKKRKYTFLIISLIMSCISVITVIFAWFSVVDKTEPIFIYSGKLEVEANLYVIYGADLKEISSEYTFEYIIPGMKEFFVLKIRNAGTIPGNLSTIFTFEGDTNAPTLSDYMVIKYDEIRGVPVGARESRFSLLNVKTIDDYRLEKNEEMEFYFSVKLLELYDGNLLNTRASIKKIEMILDQIV